MVINEPKNGMLSTREVAELLSVHTNTVRRWSNCGILKVCRIGSRRDRRFRYEDIINFLELNYPSNYLNRLVAQAEDGGNEYDRK